MASRTLRFRFDVKRPPAAIKKWWTDLPDLYEATDPREQPHRIEVVKRTPDGAVLRTHWRMPGGREFTGLETLKVGADGAWSFDLEGFFGVHVRDDFVARPAPGGAVLEVTSTLTADSLKARIALPFVARFARKAFGTTWRTAVDICERDVA